MQDYPYQSNRQRAHPKPTTIVSYCRILHLRFAWTDNDDNQYDLVGDRVPHIYCNYGLKHLHNFTQHSTIIVQYSSSLKR